jgi:predicted ATPase
MFFTLAGKTALAFQLKERVERDGGFFISGKFDQLAATCQATSKSYEPFVMACSELCHQVVKAGAEKVNMVKAAIRQALNAVEISILQDSIPALRMILGSSHHETTRRSSCGGLARGVDAEDRFGRIFCRFLFSVCSGYQSPLILFLDDIQWASDKALELIKILAVAEKKLAESKLMILCTYRDDEVLPEDILSVTMDEMKEDGVIFTDVAVSTMSDAAAHEMIADILDLSPEKCRTLALTLYHKTNGNVFFIQQLLRCLRDDGLLTFDETGELRCDESRLFLLMDNQSVLELLVNKLKQLPENAKEVLKVASCLGLAFDESVLWTAGTADKASVAIALRLAEERGLVEVNRDSAKGCFVHDKVQQAAYSLIPEKDRPAFHLNIGRKIFPIVPPKVQDANLLLLADQISRGISLVKDSSEKLAYAELYLRAGEKAARSSAYSNSAAFLALGVGLIDEEGWTEKYNIALSLYNTAAEVECYNGNFDRVDALVATVIKRARKFEDTLKAQFTRIYSLGSRNDMLGSVNEALELLEVLGQTFPRKITNFHAAIAFMKIRGKLRGKSDDEILRLPKMKDTVKLTAIQLMILIAFWANSVRKQLAPLLAVRVITLTLQYGMNDMCKCFYLTKNWLDAIVI